MIEFSKFTLDNGLRVIVHEDHTTPMCVVNVLYDVGARDEDPEKTGFAHLFEHLMFGGSVNIPVYDEPLQRAGGENNAYTTNDLTNYYCSLPAVNIETAFWLESDRMLSLDFDNSSLEVQRKVVCEEFKEHYINRPYGDVWHKLRELAYRQHPYRWMTIGKNLEHIEQATAEDVKSFFFKHYGPQNAILSVAGNVTVPQVKELAQKWFGDIERRGKSERNLPQEPPQTEANFLEVEAQVPFDALYLAWHIGGRLDPGYHTADLITEILGNGNSSRLYEKLVKERQLFSSISCSQTGSMDPGLIVIDGLLLKGVSIEEGEKAVQEELAILCREKVKAEELQKVKNRIESMLAFEDVSLSSRANSLAMYELMGDAGLINKELEKYQRVTVDHIYDYARKVFIPTNQSTLYYRSTLPAGMPLRAEMDEQSTND